MAKYRVTIIVEASNLADAVSTFLWDDSSEPVERIISIEGEAVS